MQRTLRARVVGAASAVALVASLTVALTAGSANAADPSPSDARATFVPGNVTTCAAAGFPDSIQVGSSSNTNASDANVSGVVKTNAGTTQPGQGQEVDISLLTGTVTVDAVVVKGGPAYNVYSDASVLPPALGPDQHYISPLNPGGNVPAISHWFVCYSLAAPPASGSIVVSKVVAAPDGTPVAPLPTSYSAIVTCDDDSSTTSTVTFGAGGGIGVADPPLDNLPIGTTCTVVEQGVDGFPAGTVVTYTPEGADTEGVTIPDSDVGVSVTIKNDFSDVQVLPETVVVPTTPLTPAEPVAVAPAFTG
jgi:hypothetical protein